jgi:hypothetical protein
MWTSASGQGTVLDLCEQGKKLYGSIKGTDFLHYLRDYWPLNIFCAP